MSIESDSAPAPAGSRPGRSGPFHIVAWAALALLVHLLGLLAEVAAGALLSAGIVLLVVLLS